MVVLPPEILDHIFDLLFHTDYKSLRACAEAHPFLSDLAERHLFSDIRVHCGSTGGPTFNAMALSKLFHDKPRLAKHVDSLAIELRSNALDEDCFTAISFIVTMVLRLRTIDLDSNIAWCKFPTHFREALTDCLGLPSIKRVSLSRVDDFP